MLHCCWGNRTLSLVTRRRAVLVARSFVRRKQVPRSARGTEVRADEQRMAAHQVIHQEPRCRMPSPASYAHVAPGHRFDLFAEVAEIKSPAVGAPARTENSIEQTRRIAQQDDTA